MRMHGIEYFKMLFDYVLLRTGPGVCQVAAKIRLHFPLVVTKGILLFCVTQLFLSIKSFSACHCDKFSTS
jgi:hypothetical protein